MVDAESITRSCDILLDQPQIQKSLFYLQHIHAIKQDASAATDDVALERIKQDWSKLYGQLPEGIRRAYQERWEALTEAP